MFTKKGYVYVFLKHLLIISFCREPVLAMCTVRFEGILSAAAWTNWISLTTMPPLSQNLFTTEGRTDTILCKNIQFQFSYIQYTNNDSFVVYWSNVYRSVFICNIHYCIYTLYIILLHYYIFTLYIIKYTLYIILIHYYICTLYIIQFTLYIILLHYYIYTLYIIQFTLNIILLHYYIYTLYIIQYTHYIILLHYYIYTLYIILLHYYIYTLLSVKTW